MADIFSNTRAIDYKGAFSVDDVVLTLSGLTGDLGALVQSVSGSYARSVTRVSGLTIGGNGADKKPSVLQVGTPTGQVQIATMLAGPSTSTAIITQLGNACTANSLTVSATAGCNTKTPTYTMNYALLSNVGFGVSVEGAMMTESLAATFLQATKS